MKTDAILTKREAEVVRLYAEGYIGKEVADILNTSYRTIVNHTQNIYEKTGIKRSINALVSWWFCVNFSINITQTAKSVIAGVLLLICIPREILAVEETHLRYKSAKRSEVGYVFACEIEG